MTTFGRTHQVENQPPELRFNAYSSDPSLRAQVAALFPGTSLPEDARLRELGESVGHEASEWARLANAHPPEARFFDRMGRRINEVEFHPAYHQLMELAISHEVPSYGWNRPELKYAQVIRAIKFYLYNQGDQGTACPLTMTFASIPAIRKSKALRQQLEPLILAAHYDPRSLPLDKKRGLTLGMGMTEKQGGSDVRQNTTKATLLSSQEGLYSLVGHKWFLSAPMSDAWLVLAKIDEALTCFFVPRVLPNGERNAVDLQRLKDKLGDRSNASSEVEFRGALGWLIGEPGRGIANILEMVSLTRLDCMIGSAGSMRRALVEAIHYARHRHVFGKLLVKQPLMENVLADLAIESEGHLALSLRVAKAFDRAPYDAEEKAFFRLATSLGKYWVCKRAPIFIAEAQECLGGSGYIEESPMARYYRQAPLNSIWEGSGNVQCLDVMRALKKDPLCEQAFLKEVAQAKGAHPALDEAMKGLPDLMERAKSMEVALRTVLERLAVILTASLLQKGDPRVFQAYCESRLLASHATFGSLPSKTPMKELIERAFTP